MKIEGSMVKCPLCESREGFEIVLDVGREVHNSVLISYQYVSTFGLLHEMLRLREDETYLEDVIENRVGKGTRVMCETCNIDDTVQNMPIELDTIVSEAL